MYVILNIIGILYHKRSLTMGRFIDMTFSNTCWGTLVEVVSVIKCENNFPFSKQWFSLSLNHHALRNNANVCCYRLEPTIEASMTEHNEKSETSHKANTNTQKYELPGMCKEISITTLHFRRPRSNKWKHISSLAYTTLPPPPYYHP